MKKTFTLFFFVLISVCVFSKGGKFVPTKIIRQEISKKTILVQTDKYIYIKTSDICIAEEIDSKKEYNGKYIYDNVFVYYYKTKKLDKIKTYVLSVQSCSN